MTSGTIGCELRSRSAWPVRVEGASADELLAQLRRLFDHEPVLDSFTVVFDAPVPLEVRERLTAAVLEAITAYSAARWEFCDWVDDLVDESGWQGVRASIDPGLAPCFAGGDETGDRRHVGLWADDRTFLHVEISSLDSYDRSWPQTSWCTTWVHLSHWHPNSMTSGSWSDELFAVGSGEGASALVGVRHKDEDGRYSTVSPLPTDAATAARLVADFIEESSIGGVEGQLVPLIALSLPADGSTSAFPIDLLPGGQNPGYELSSLHVTPPADVMAALLARATMDVQGARAMRDAIVAGVREIWGADATLEELYELDDAWRSVLARLEELSG